MNPNTELKNRTWKQIKSFAAVAPTVLLPCVVVLVLALAVRARAETPPAAIPISDIGTKATADYHGDALGIAATADGALLRCGFQKVEGRATAGGLWLESTKPGAAGKLRVIAASFGREGSSTVNVQMPTTLPATGAVSVQDKTVRFARPGLTEEYSVSVDGVRQDFVVGAPPAGTGDLRVEMALTGARAETTAGGVRLILEGSGRALAYGRLHVEDATGRELTARLEVVSVDRLAVNVSDANATYPVRIDPTFSDADWVTLNPGMPGANGVIYAMVVDGDGNLYIGGSFSLVGTVLANNIARWDGSGWSALGSGTSPNVGGGYYGGVYALALSGTDLYVGGDFTNAGGVAANAIAKWDGSAWSALGSWTVSFHYRPVINALAISGTDLYAAGYFTNAGGVAASSIAKWDGSAWSALGSGMNLYGGVAALAVSGNSLYAGGSFTNAGGVAASSIAKWDGSAWSALGSGMNLYGGVAVLAVSGTTLYAGGEFTNAGGVAANYIAKWDGSTWSALGSGMNYFVGALAVSGTTLYAGGEFSLAGGVPANGIAKWDGSTWSAVGSGMNSYVYALAVSGTNMWAGGQFTTAGGIAANYVANWDGSAWSALGLGMNGHVSALAVSGTTLYAGGQFTTAGDVTANYVAKWDGNTWSALGSGMSGSSAEVNALVVSGTNLYAGGNFTNAGGVSANCIAKWDGSAWSALGSGIGGLPPSSSAFPYVGALAVIGTNLYVGGGFTTAGGMPANGIAKWDGNTWSALDSGIGGSYGTVSALAVSGTNLYVGGGFIVAGVATANCVAKWDGHAWSALGSGMAESSPDLGVYVSALAVSGTNLYAGGQFTAAGGVTAGNIAKWDGNAWSALGLGTGDSNPYAAVLASDGTNLYVGGRFINAGGVMVSNIAKWDGNTWSALGSGTSGPWPGVIAMAADGVGHLFVGGDFYQAGTNVSPYIAEANVVSLPTILVSPQTQTAEMGATVDFGVRAVGFDLTYELFFNATNLLSSDTNGCLEVTAADFSQSGVYTVVVTNFAGAVTSAPVMLNVIPPVERRPVPAINLIAPPGNFLGLDYRDDLGPATNWATMATITLSNASQFYCDVSQPLPPQRFYRAWQSGSPDVVPSLSLPGMVPAITLTGNIGDSLRVDYINQFGPTDAWVTLATVTLTNTSQLYFDTSVFGQPARLWRIVPVP